MKQINFTLMLRPLMVICAMITGSSTTLADDALKDDMREVLKVAAFKTVENEEVRLSDYEGKALLVVNTASECGFTKQYADMQTLYDRYKDKGLVVIAIPSNDFGGQEPLDNAEIQTFCETNFNVTFPIMNKVAVKGENAHPFYAHINKILPFSATPKWNFHKYLISPDGKLVDWFSSVTSPTSDRVTKAVEAVLPPSDIRISAE
jgi:glutathione peroxidase